MKADLALTPALELGSLRAEARFQEPDVRLSCSRDEDPALHLEEGGIVVVLAFVDRASLCRFLHRLAHLSLPRHD